MDASTRGRPRRRRGRLGVLVLAIVLSPVVCELWLRWLIFGESERARRMGAELRDPTLYASWVYDDAYWRLRRALGRLDGAMQEPPQLHPRLGWLSNAIHPETLASRADPHLAGRRPVLFYGASFAARSYSALAEHSDLAEDHFIVPYGVGGYGVDQVYLLMKGSLDHYVDRDPVVVIGLKADGDFERAALSVRVWPKPRFRLDEAGELELERETVPAPADYDAESSVGIASYAWAYLTNRGSFLPEPLRRLLAGADGRERRTRAVVEALVRAIDAEVRARGVRYGYLLFCGPRTLQGEETGLAQEAFVVGLLEREGIPYVLVRPQMLAAAASQGERPRDYFHPAGHALADHPTALGKRRIFPALRRAILGDYDSP